MELKFTNTCVTIFLNFFNWKCFLVWWIRGWQLWIEIHDIFNGKLRNFNKIFHLKFFNKIKNYFDPEKFIRKILNLYMSENWLKISFMKIFELLIQLLLFDFHSYFELLKLFMKKWWISKLFTIETCDERITAFF